MITNLEYALMAGRAYQTNRGDFNWFSVPTGWNEFFHVPNNPAFTPSSSGFEATSFINDAGTEIVISYAGTDALFSVDNFANFGLATGFGSAQLNDAAAYYLQVRQANPNATITFTGHSLGGGLAVLMGVFFGEQAVTFDQAPFANSAELSLVHPDVAANLKADLLAHGYSEADLAGLTNFLQLRETNGGIPNSELVSTFRVTGEFTSSTFPFYAFDSIGAETPLTHGPADWFGASFDLHAQSLLATFVQNDAFRQVTFKLTDLLGMVFDNNLYEFSTDTDDENFLERLVRHQNGNAPGVATADAMLTRFTDDLWKLAQDGGLTMADDPTALTRFVSNALTAFAMQMYYEDTANATNANKELFTDLATAGLGSGGIQFDRLDVATTLDQAKGYNLYFQNYLNSTAFTDNERQLIQSLLPTLRDWYVQAGSGGINVADAQNRGAFMLGGNGADNLTGGSQTDLLVGNAGVDTLNGGGGNDTLLGGSGFDTYVYRVGDGQDVISDADPRGVLFYDGQLIVGGLRPAGSTGAYTSMDGTFTFVHSGNDLVINNLMTIKNYTPGGFGIRLEDKPNYGVETRTEFLKIDHYDATPTGFVPVYAAFFDDNANDTATTANPGQLVPAIGDENNLIHAGGGNDRIISGAGDDQLYGEGDSDEIYGGLGHDRLYGGIGGDELFGDNVAVSTSGGNDFLDGGEGDDLVQGGAGRDIVFGGAGNDNLNGDEFAGDNAGGFDDYLDGEAGDDELHGAAGSDVLIGGVGNDLLIGDTTQYQNGTPEAGGNDSLDGGEGQDQLFGLYGDDLLSGGTGNDLVNGQDGSDVLYGGEGDDTLSGDLRIVALGGGYDSLEYRAAGGNDLLNGDAGIDVLYGGEGDDILFGGTENDTLYGEYNANLFSPFDPLNAVLHTVMGNDVLFGDDGNDVLYGGNGNDTLLGGAGNDQLSDDEPGYATAGGNDILDGGAGADSLESWLGDDVLHGGAGNDSLRSLGEYDILQGYDMLYGDDGDDFLFSAHESLNTGNSMLIGGLGNDTYEIDSLGDVVVEAAGEGIDTVRSPVSYTLPDNVENLRGGGAVGIGNELDNVMRGAARLEGLGGNDTLTGGPGNDILNGGLGVDVLSGGGGNDLLYIDADDTSVSGGAGSSDQVIVTGVAGVTLNVAAAGIEIAFGGDGNDMITGSAATGPLSLDGGAGNDVLTGGSGSDGLAGGDGHDSLRGGAGNDLLRGGAGNDTYVFNLGDRIDTIEDTAATGEGNRIQFGAGIANGDLVYTEDRTARILTIQVGSGGDALRLTNFDPTGATGSLVVENLTFADGSTVNLADFFPPFVNHAPTLAAPLADQTVQEDASFTLVVPADTFTDEDAGDVLTLRASQADGTALPAWLSFDAATATFSGTPDDAQVGTLDLRMTATDREDLTVSDVFSLTVANVNEAPTVVAPPADQQATEDTAFSFVVPAGTFVDVDQVHGDTLTYSATLADGTALPTWLSFDPTTRTFGGTPLNSDVGTLALTVTATDQGTLSTSAGFTLSVQNTNDAPTVANPMADQTAAEDSAFTFTVPNTTFADADLIHGDILTYSATLADGSPLPAWLSFNPSSSTFSGTPGAGDAGSLQIAVTATDTGNLSATDLFTLAISGPRPQTVIGTAGNDLLTGGRGDDTLIGLAGNDTLNGGQGHDQLDGGTGTDTMQGGTGNDTYIVDVSGDVVTELANEGTDTVQSSITSTLGAHVENLTLTGTANLNGTGNVLDNTLMGNSGINVLTGGGGNDTYLVGAGDTVVEHLNGGTDTVVSSVTWTLGANVENLTLTGTTNLSGTGSSANNVLVGNSGNNTIDGGSGNDRVDGGEGSDSLLGGSGDDQLLGGLGNDVLNAGSGHDVLNGGDGTDTLDGGSGDDQLLGGAGSDTLTGGSGADKFTGGTGNDTLTGGSGNDLYNFSRGDGQDMIGDSDPFPGNQDRTLFGATINPLDLVISRQANDLRLTIHGSSDQITVRNWYVGTREQIETIQAGNGQTLLNTQVDQLIQAMAGFTQQTGLTWDQAIDQRPQEVQTVLAASWQ